MPCQSAFTPLMVPYAEAARASGDKVEALQAEMTNHFDMMTPRLPYGDKTIEFIATKASSKP